MILAVLIIAILIDTVFRWEKYVSNENNDKNEVDEIMISRLPQEFNMEELNGNIVIQK